MVELKNCPFCGSKPKLFLGKKRSCQLHGNPYQGIIIKCSNPYCIAKDGSEFGDVFDGGEQKARQEAVDKWNTRAAPTVEPQTVTDNTAVISNMQKRIDELEAEVKSARNRALEESCGVVYGYCQSDNVAQRTVNAIRALKTEE